MALNPCNWKRFWHPLELRPHVGTDGFLYDPESEFGRAVNPHLAPFEAIREVPCVILLGEPGMGKSTVIKEVARNAIGDSEVHLLDLLRDCGTDTSLHRTLFDAPWFRAWKEDGSQKLDLLLDSLDECRIRFQTITAVLARALEGLPRDRLKLRVVCRTAEWPDEFGKQLANLWPELRFTVSELAPLRRQDVVSAATSHGIDPEQFVRQVTDRGVQAFASRPITLELLINVFQRGGQLPTRLAEIYDRGLPLLCEETPGREEVGLHARLSGREQVAVASRIAAALVLSNGTAVRTDSDVGKLEPGEVLVSDLTGYSEVVDGTDLSVDEATILEAVSSGLFSFAGPGRRAVAHQTYTEFLVARYLDKAGLSKKQIHNLIGVPDEQGLTIAPQLEEIVAWLASMNDEIFNDVQEHQPEVLVRGDIATLDTEVRRELVERLLIRVSRGAIADWLQLSPHLKKLGHPALANQLRTWLSDDHTSDTSGHLAICDGRARRVCSTDRPARLGQLRFCTHTQCTGGGVLGSASGARYRHRLRGPRQDRDVQG